MHLHAQMHTGVEAAAGTKKTFPSGKAFLVSGPLIIYNNNVTILYDRSIAKFHQLYYIPL